MATSISIANLALSSIAADYIAAFDEDSVQSREVNLHFQTTLDEVNDWYPWPLNIRRVVLASVANDRPAEWVYCYAQPTDMADPIAIRQVEEDAQSLPLRGPSTFPMQDASPNRFAYEGGKIYTNVENATLVYTTRTVTAVQLPPLVRQAFVIELASRLAYPIKKDLKLQEKRQREAEALRQRAIADEQNKNPQSAPRWISDVEFARAGMLDD